MTIKDRFTLISESIQRISTLREQLSPNSKDDVDPLLAALISSNAQALAGPGADNITPEITLLELDVLSHLLPPNTSLEIESEAGITFINLIPPKSL